MRKSGVKFGLIGTASSLKKGKGGRPIGAKPEPRRRPPGATSVFDANSDDEEGSNGVIDGVAAVNKRLAAISAKQEKQAKKEYEDALEADPSVFDYDRVYDGMKESRESKIAAATIEHEKEKRKPKYIGNLLKQAKMRAVESDRIFDRKLQKEREEQDKLEGEATMKFVTSAYKKKLMEQKKWELQQQLEDEREQRNDVTKTGMSGFYSNLITKNIAMGGDVEKSANSAFTAGSKRHAATDDYEMQDGNDRKSAGPAAPAGSKKGERRANDDDADDGAETVDDNNASSPGNEADDERAPAGPTARMVDPRAAASKRGREEQAAGGLAGAAAEGVNAGREPGSAGGGTAAGSGGSGDTVRHRKDDEIAGGTAKRARLGEGEGKGEVPGGVSSGGWAAGAGHGGEERTAEEKSAAEALEKAEKAAAAKAKKEAAIKAARERFLARKKAS
eukprot:g13112.t1